MTRHIRILLSLLVLSLALTVVAVPAGSGAAGTGQVERAAKASLKVKVKGLPKGAKAVVKVKGPNGFKATVKATTTLRSLRAGSYKVIAKKVTLASGATATPRTRRQKVTLSAGRKTVTVRYVTSTVAPPPGTPSAGVVSTLVRDTGSGPPDSWLALPSVSPDGRWVAFSSTATDLGLGSSFEAQVYLLDRATGSLHLVSEALGGGPAHGGWSATPSVSDDGRYVAYESAATDLVDRPFPTSGNYNIFLWDRMTGTNTLVSDGFDDEMPNGQSFEPDISGDGRHVAFSSQASNLVDPTTYGPDTNGLANVFSWDRTTGQTVLVDRTPEGTFSSGGAVSAATSTDGRFVAFSSDGDDLVPGAGSPGSEQAVFVWDRTAGTSAYVAPGNLPSISGDGGVVAYMEPFTSGTAQDVLVWRRATGVSEVVSQTPTDGTANNDSTWPVVSADGGFVVFLSKASNLVARPDGPASDDVFVWSAAADRTDLVTEGLYGDAVGAELQRPAIVSGGAHVVFVSSAAALVDQAIAAGGDLFLWTRR